MDEQTGRIDWNADEVDILCFAAEMMQTNIRKLIRQKNFDIPSRDAAVKSLSLLLQAQSKLKAHAPSMHFDELASLYGALLLLRDTLKKSAEGSDKQRNEEIDCLKMTEALCAKFEAALKNNGVEDKRLFQNLQPRRWNFITKSRGLVKK